MRMEPEIGKKLSDKSIVSRGAGLGPAPFVPEIFVDGARKSLSGEGLAKIWLYTDLWSEKDGEPQERSAVVLTMTYSTVVHLMSVFAHLRDEMKAQAKQPEEED